MADIIKKAILLLMSEQCFDNYFMDFNFFDGKDLTQNYLMMSLFNIYLIPFSKLWKGTYQ